MAEKIKFQLDISKVLELLSERIYDSPYAMLRENIQNAYDAILLRTFRESGKFDPLITVTITKEGVTVEDNGIGMTFAEVQNNYWRAGASGKNTPEARSAGVVGTFGIGALANFGICESLIVETESMLDGSRTRSTADRNSLSLDSDCIVVERLPTGSKPGTTVIAQLEEKTTIDVDAAVAYLLPFTKHIPIPIKINGITVSMKPLEESCPSGAFRWSTVLANQSAQAWQFDIETRISENGIIWVRLTNLRFDGNSVDGEVVLRQGTGQIMACHSRFGLARTGVWSNYSLGGVADLKILQPTAGRDALTSQSIQVLQSLVSAVEELISPIMADTEYADQNTDFMTWVTRNGRYDLCGKLRANVLPARSKPWTLREVANLSQKIRIHSYDGRDESIAQSYSSETNPLIRIAQSNPRARCEEGYLARYSKIVKVSNEPQILGVRASSSWTLAEAALAFRLQQTLENDYFVPVVIKYGQISHNLPVLLKEEGQSHLLTLSSENASIATLLQLYQSDYATFGPIVKDFVRNVIFPRISHLVPSSTKQGAESFLKILRRQRDTFEYDLNDMRKMEEVIAGFTKGNLQFGDMITRALATTRKQQQFVSAQDLKSAGSVIPDVVHYDQIFEKEEAKEQQISSPFSPKPAILRPDVETDAKLLELDDSQIRDGFKGFLRLSERAYSDKGEFFLQPHSTEVIWGGQRVMFIFKHISGEFGFYYDVLLNELLSIPPSGRNFETLSIVLKNSVFVPIPQDLYKYFTPGENETKRFDVRYDILYPE